MPEDWEYKWPYEGRTDVDAHVENDDGSFTKSAECFRTTATKGYCRCGWINHPFVIDWEGKCVRVDRTVHSCEKPEDVAEDGEGNGLLECPEGHEIRIATNPRFHRADANICSAGLDPNGTNV